uniref:Drosophila melanogaster clone 1 dromepin-6 mRNA n=1 Tax=Drosophila melanogaster TaxID=7227 RepID=A0A0C5B5R8_DROME|nr:dromepin-6 [Drosophila melanogaster]
MRSVLPSVGFLLLLALLLLALLLGSSCTESGRVIYFNQLNTTQALEAAKNNSDALGKGMLLDVRGNRCPRGFVRDHHGRCRRRV